MSDRDEDLRIKAFLSILDRPNQQVIEECVNAALYAFSVTVHDLTYRRVFAQDFAAALNRRQLLAGEQVETFWPDAEKKMEAAFPLVQRTKSGKPKLRGGGTIELLEVK